jgi:hypothetical protein
MAAWRRSDRWKRGAIQHRLALIPSQSFRTDVAFPFAINDLHIGAPASKDLFR